MFCDANSFDQDLSSWDISEVIWLDAMFGGGALSTSNYNALLIGWESQDVHNDLCFDAGNSQYSSGDPAEARQRLIDEHEWMITDGGEVQ